MRMTFSKRLFTAKIILVFVLWLWSSKPVEAGSIVTADTTPPAIASANLLGYDTFLQVVFSKPVTPATANAVGNYSIDNGVTVNSATLQSDGVTVNLRTSKMDLTKALTLSVNGIKDYAQTPNTLNNGTVQFGAIPGTITRNYI